MTPGKNRLFITCILTTLTITLLIPFAGRAGAQTDQPEERINRIALMPFLLGGSEAIKEHRLEKSLDCQLRGLCTLMDNLESNSGKTLTGIFKDELLKIYPYQLVPIAQSQQVYDSLSGKLNKTPRELAVELGKQLGADHVLGGLVWRFREREGNTMSVVQPASVSFSAYLIRVADGTVTEDPDVGYG